MRREKIGLIIIISCCLLLLTMALIQLPNEVEQTKLINDTPVIFNDVISTNAHDGSGGRYIPIQNVSYSPVNATFYAVAGGGGGAGSMGYRPHMETK